MPIRKGYRQLLAEANPAIATLPATSAMGLVDDPGTLFVDLRDPAGA
jgi:hypothetical protein